MTIGLALVKKTPLKLKSQTNPHFDHVHLNLTSTSCDLVLILQIAESGPLTFFQEINKIASSNMLNLILVLINGWEYC